MSANSVKVTLSDPNQKPFTVGIPGEDAWKDVYEQYSTNKALVIEGSKVGGTNWASLLFGILPFLLFLGFWLFLMNQVQGGGSKVMSFGKSRAKRMAVDSPKVTFKDVAGADEAVEELHEIKDFLENPKKYQALGARIPKGVLLFGSPGTGKTLLARAVAGEAGVPFFSISGSDFVEMFVGVGASRVRDLFEQAKQNSPCIIFMDEIDAVGRHRGAGMGGGHDEREQTLNQLLVEMDGFETKDNIILIAATNRPDILDPALLRPGRFDRQIAVDRPDRAGREQILRVHTRGKPISKTVDLAELAGQTPGFTGADLANLVNEAALLTARHGKKTITKNELEEGIMRVIAGPEKKTRLLSEKERLITAYHEMGHALVGHFLPNCDPVHKISVISRGQALGYTISMPSEDKFLTTKAALHGHARHDARWSRGGGARVRRGHHRRRERHREGHRQLEEHGDALGHEREARPARARRPPRPAVPRAASSVTRPTTRRRSPARSTTRSAASSRRRTTAPARCSRAHVEELHRLSKILLEVETIDRDQFLRLLDGEAEERSSRPPPRRRTPEPADAGERREAKPRGLGLPLPGTPDTPGAGA